MKWPGLPDVLKHYWPTKCPDEALDYAKEHERQLTQEAASLEARAKEMRDEAAKIAAATARLSASDAWKAMQSERYNVYAKSLEA